MVRQRHGEWNKAQTATLGGLHGFICDQQMAPIGMKGASPQSDLLYPGVSLEKFLVFLSINLFFLETNATSFETVILKKNLKYMVFNCWLENDWII